MNNVFLRYERFQKNQPQASPENNANRHSGGGATAASIGRKEEERPLIDFGDDKQTASSRPSEKCFFIYRK